MKIKYLLLLIFLVSCGTFSEAGKALRNEKTRTTDEFLIEKRGPLSIPPNINELPKPSSNNPNEKGVSVNTKIPENNPKEKSEIENILLEEIRKN